MIIISITIIIKINIIIIITNNIMIICRAATHFSQNSPI